MALTTDDRRAFAYARFAGLKAALKLTADQEKNWPAVEAAFIDAARARAARGQEVRQLRSKPLDLAERMRDRAKGLRSRAEHVEKVAAAAGPLLKSLDDGQRRRFALVLRALKRRRQLRRQVRRQHRRMARVAAAK